MQSPRREFDWRADLILRLKSYGLDRLIRKGQLSANALVQLGIISVRELDTIQSRNGIVLESIEVAGKNGLTFGFKILGSGWMFVVELEHKVHRQITVTHALSMIRQMLAANADHVGLTFPSLQFTANWLAGKILANVSATTSAQTKERVKVTVKKLTTDLSDEYVHLGEWGDGLDIQIENVPDRFLFAAFCEQIILDGFSLEFSAVIDLIIEKNQNRADSRI